MKRNTTVMALAVVLALFVLGGCNPILNLIGLGSIVLEDFELDSNDRWSFVGSTDGSNSTVDWARTSAEAIGGDYSLEVTFSIWTDPSSVGSGMLRELDGAPQDWSKLTAISFQMNPNGATGAFTLGLNDSDGTQMASVEVIDPIPFSGTGWEEFYVDFSDFGIAGFALGDDGAFDWEQVSSIVLWFGEGSGTVYIDDIVGEWSLFK